MKRVLAVVMALACLLTLAACGCEHEWKEADCETPMTCNLCGKTKGEALGHDWQEADCETAKTCKVCGKTEGEALGHDWQEADCETAKTCKVCGKTEGEALGHNWEDATTEAPKTCNACGKTEGERIITDARFTTAACKSVFGTWQTEAAITGADMEMPDFQGELRIAVTIDFDNAGNVKIASTAANVEEFETEFTIYLTVLMYSQFASSGYDQTTADAAMQEVYGMTTPEYCAAVVDAMDFAGLAEEIGGEGVYYIEDGKIYAGESWDEIAEGYAFTVEGDKLTVADGLGISEGKELVFTRTAE